MGLKGDVEVTSDAGDSHAPSSLPSAHCLTGIGDICSYALSNQLPLSDLQNSEPLLNAKERD